MVPHTVVCVTVSELSLENSSLSMVLGKGINTFVGHHCGTWYAEHPPHFKGVKLFPFYDPNHPQLKLSQEQLSWPMYCLKTIYKTK